MDYSPWRETWTINRSDPLTSRLIRTGKVCCGQQRACLVNFRTSLKPNIVFSVPSIICCFAFLLLVALIKSSTTERKLACNVFRNSLSLPHVCSLPSRKPTRSLRSSIPKVKRKPLPPSFLSLLSSSDEREKAPVMSIFRIEAPKQSLKPIDKLLKCNHHNLAIIFVPQPVRLVYLFRLSAWDIWYTEQNKVTKEREVKSIYLPSFPRSPNIHLSALILLHWSSHLRRGKGN